MSESSSIRSFAGVTVDFARGSLTRDGREFRLRPKSFAVLKYLVEHKQRLVTKQELMQAVWTETVVTDDSLVQCVLELRRAMGDEAQRLIKTVPRRGYIFEVDVSDARSTANALKSIAVLPFHQLDSQDAEPFVGLGIADTLIGRLTSIGAISVRPTSAVRKYSGLGQDSLVAGRELAVDWVLEGSIRHMGERVRATVHLIDVQAGKPAWSQVFDEGFTDIFAVEDAITLRVARALLPRLTGSDEQYLTRRFTDDPYAYQLYLRGRYFLQRRTQEGFSVAIDCFNGAITKDPNYAPAFAGLADAYSLQGLYAIALKSPIEVYPKAEAAARRALTIDGTLAEAHAALALSALNYDWDWRQAEQAFARAIELNPDYATLFHWYSHLLTAMGRSDESLAVSVRAVELDPHDLPLRSHLIWHHWQARQYDEAIARGCAIIQTDANFIPARLYTGLAYEGKGLYDEAVAQFENALGACEKSRSAVLLAALGHTLAIADRRREAKRILRRLNDLETQQYVSPFTIALIHAALGDWDSAFTRLRQACDRRDNWLIYLNVDPRLDGVRADPRFSELVAKVGLL